MATANTSDETTGDKKKKQVKTCPDPLCKDQELCDRYVNYLDITFVRLCKYDYFNNVNKENLPGGERQRNDNREACIAWCENAYKMVFNRPDCPVLDLTNYWGTPDGLPRCERQHHYARNVLYPEHAGTLDRELHNPGRDELISPRFERSCCIDLIDDAQAFERMFLRL